MNKERRNTLITTTTLVLLIFTIGFLSVEMRKADVAKDELNDEKLTAESLLSEKLLLEKEIDKLKVELEKINVKNADLFHHLNTAEQKLAIAERQLAPVQKRNADIHQLKKQIEELTRQKKNLENEVSESRNVNQQFKSSNDDLMQTVILLQQENKKLRDELSTAGFASLSESLIETTLRNKKLTASARRTKKLVITTDVPAHSKELKLNIISPDGNKMVVRNSDVNVQVLTGEFKSQAFYTPSGVSSGRNTKRVAITYSPDEKLQSGLYRIQLTNDSSSVGALQVRLR